MIESFQEKSLFCACFLKNLRQFLGGYLSVIIIFLIVCNTTKSEPINANSQHDLDSRKIVESSMKTNQHEHKRDLNYKGYFNPEALDSTNQSKSKKASQTIPEMMVQQNNNSYVMLSPVHSSAFHNLIDLLSHSLFKKPENNINDEKFAPDHLVNPKASLDNKINTLKPETNLSESVPYFDMLYDLAKDIDPVYSERPDKPSCTASNNSVSNHVLSFNNDDSITEKPYLGCNWNDLSVKQKQKYLEINQGPRQRFSKSQAVPITIYYGALLAVGVPGNLLTCLIITTNSYMRTPPNFFLLNLAATDLLTLTLIPIEIILFWNHYPWRLGSFGCAIASVVSELVSYVSIGTMICFTMERYTAICHPLKPSLHSGKRRTIYIIVAIWIFCMMPSAWWLVYGKIQYMYYNPWKEDHYGGKDEEMSLQKQGYVRTEESATCMIAETSVTPTMLSITGTTFIFFYLLPITVLPIIYSRISKAMKHSEALSNSASTGTAENCNRKTVLRIQIAVIVCFLICWTPYHIERILFVIVNMKKQLKKLHTLHETLHAMSGCCFFLSSVVNPFLYSLLSKRFRRGYQDLIRKIKIWILNLPFRLYSPEPLSKNSISQDDKRMNIAENPNVTTQLKQEREGLVNSMCCARIMVEQSSFRWKTCSTTLQNTGHRKGKSQFLEVYECKEELEMNHIPMAERFDTCSNHESDSDKFYSVGSCIPIPETKTTSLFVPDYLYEPLIKAEDDAPVVNSRKNSSSSNLPSLLTKRRASEGSTNPLINAHIIGKQNSNNTSKSYGNMFPIRRKSMLFVFDSYINTSCVY